MQPNGGIYDPKSRIQNYETCLGVVCFSEANVKGRYDAILKNADKYLKGLQSDEENGRKPSRRRIWRRRIRRPRAGPICRIRIF